MRFKPEQAYCLPVIIWLLLFLMVLEPVQSKGQQKTKRNITIEHADALQYNDEIIKDAQRLIGNVLITHKKVVMKCDSAWSYTNSNMVDAFGHVHIINNDTINLWADFINYDGDADSAKARKNVVLKDPEITLTTDSLDFDLNQKIGYYNCGGKIVDSANVLTSTIGRYYIQTDELFFTKKVKLVNDEYTIHTDTMTYNTKTEIVKFKGKTTIIGDSTYVYSTSGWFNTQTNELKLNKNSTIRRGNTQIQAEHIFYNDNTGNGNAHGNVIINDFLNHMIVQGNKAEYNDFSQYALITDSAVWIQYNKADSLFLHADTLYTMPDTAAPGEKLLITYHNIRFYRTDIQGTCDSLVYITRDSTIQLYYEPVLWSKENQMTADFIEFINNTPPPNRVYLNGNSFIIQRIDTSKYNQIKGKNMVGLINGEFLYRIDVDGNGQSVYYPADKKDFIGLNYAESSNIIIYLAENKIRRITFVGSPVGVMKPLFDIVPEDTKLPDFKWRADERPVDRFDIFDGGGKSEGHLHLPQSDITKKALLESEKKERIMQVDSIQ